MCPQPESYDRVQKTDLTAKWRNVRPQQTTSLEKGKTYWSLIVITLIYIESTKCHFTIIYTVRASSMGAKTISVIIPFVVENLRSFIVFEIKFVFYFLVFFFFGRSDERDGHSCTILLSILINILLFFCLFVFPFLAFKMFIQYKNVFVRLKICRR